MCHGLGSVGPGFWLHGGSSEAMDGARMTPGANCSMGQGSLPVLLEVENHGFSDWCTTKLNSDCHYDVLED